MERRERDVVVPAGNVLLEGVLALPPRASGLVVIAHASGSSRYSPSTRVVADVLHDRGLGTLRVDLLTGEEEVMDARTAALRFDVRLLARRLLGTAEWMRRLSETRDLALGLMGSSTGAAAALLAVAVRPDLARAVVSRGGRPDLATTDLPRVTTPTDLIVGGADQSLLELNREALARLRCEKRLDVVPGGTSPGAPRGASTRADPPRWHVACGGFP